MSDFEIEKEQRLSKIESEKFQKMMGVIG